jgi:hypothetical protein
MKSLIVLPFCVLVISLKAQIFPMVEGKVVYEQIDSVRSTKEELFLRSKVWLVKSFKSAKSVIQLEDKDVRKLMGKGMDTYLLHYGMNQILVTGGVYYTIQIDCRDNKARIRIFDLEQGDMQGPSQAIEVAQYWPRKVKPLVEAQINTRMLALLGTFKDGISKSASDTF